MHPWTSLTALAALILTGYSYIDHARASDVAAALGELKQHNAVLAEQLIDIRASQIEDKLLNARTRYCHAQDDDQRMYFRNLVSEYADKYRKVTERTYMLPSCSEV